MASSIGFFRQRQMWCGAVHVELRLLSTHGHTLRYGGPSSVDFQPYLPRHQPGLLLSAEPPSRIVLEVGAFRPRPRTVGFHGAETDEEFGDGLLVHTFDREFAPSVRYEHVYRGQSSRIYPLRKWFEDSDPPRWIYTRLVWTSGDQ
jgi:hypothetical protein